MAAAAHTAHNNLPNDSRKQIAALRNVAALDTGTIQRVLAAQNVHCGKRSIQRVLERDHTEGSPLKRPKGGNHSQTPCSSEERSILCGAQSANAALTLKQLKAKLPAPRGKTFVHQTLQRAGFTTKQMAVEPEYKNDEENKQLRIKFSDIMTGKRRGRRDPPDEFNCVFPDETPFQQSMARKRGRSLKGHPARKPARTLKGVNHSVTAAMMPKHGLLGYTVHVNRKGGTHPGTATQRFVEFMEHICSSVLPEKLIDWPCWFIMDNCSSHNEEQVRAVLKKHGHQLLFMPAYSPQFNPIENCFSAWKAVTFSREMRDSNDLRAAIDDGAKAVTPAVTSNAWEKMKNAWVPQALAGSNF